MPTDVLDLDNPTTIEGFDLAIERELKAAGSLADLAQSEGRDFNDVERGKAMAHVEKARDLGARRKSLAGPQSLVDGLKGLLDGFDFSKDHAKPGKGKTLGERFTTAEPVVEYIKGKPTGDTSRFGDSPSVQFNGFKDILASGDHDAGMGPLVEHDWRGLLDDGGVFRRPLVIRDLVTIGQTGSDTVEYAKVTGFTNNADVVPEARGTSAGTASGDVSGVKPESDLEVERARADVVTIAHWVPATKRALSDAAQTRTLIDLFLRYGLDEKMEDEIVSGPGTGEHFEGILEVDGTQAQAWDTNLLVTTRKARTKVRTVGRARPTAYAFNPTDMERIDLLRDESGGAANTGAFFFGGPAALGTPTLWGLPRVEAEAIPAGVGIVADWRQAVVWDREQAGIMASDSHANFFVRNLVAILAELRLAFGIIRPSAFVIIDLTA